MNTELQLALINSVFGTSEAGAINTPVSNIDPILEVGKCYLFRGVTNYTLGRIELIDREKDRVKVTDASWVADTGCWSELLKNGCGGFKEVEPYPSFAIVNLAACNDIAPWEHVLPSKRIGG